MKGKLSWSDPRVVETLTWVKQLVDAGAFPTSFTSLKLGESHIYFHTNPGALMFQVASWYTARAFNPPDKGGQPADFPLGIMQSPAMTGGACNDCKSMAVGGSYVVNAASPRKDLGIAFLNSFATPEMGNAGSRTCWCRPASRPTRRRSPARTPATSSSSAKANEGNTYYFGTADAGDARASPRKCSRRSSTTPCRPGRSASTTSSSR